MSIESQKADPALHQAVLALMRVMKSEGLLSERRSPHEMYVGGGDLCGYVACLSVFMCMIRMWLRLYLHECVAPIPRYDMARRFYLGNKKDSKVAETKLRECLIWRRDMQVDTIFDEDRKILPKEVEDLLNVIYPYAFHGTGVGGRAVYIERTGLIDRDSLYSKVTTEQLEVHFSWVMDKMYATLWQNSMRLYNRKKQIEEERRKKELAKAAAAAGITQWLLVITHFYFGRVHIPHWLRVDDV